MTRHGTTHHTAHTAHARAGDDQQRGRACGASHLSSLRALPEVPGDLFVSDELHAVVANEAVLGEVVVVVVLVARTEHRTRAAERGASRTQREEGK